MEVNDPLVNAMLPHGVTTSGKYVFDVSMTSAAADLVEVRKLAEAIDTSLSAL